jgi:hypothetical protein
MCWLARCRQRKHFFFEKKKQKTFIFRRVPSINARLKKQKFFGSFFQKRTFFFPRGARDGNGIAAGFTQAIW